MAYGGCGVNGAGVAAGALPRLCQIVDGRVGAERFVDGQHGNVGGPLQRANQRSGFAGLLAGASVGVVGHSHDDGHRVTLAACSRIAATSARRLRRCRYPAGRTNSPGGMLTASPMRRSPTSNPTDGRHAPGLRDQGQATGLPSRHLPRVWPANCPVLPGPGWPHCPGLRPGVPVDVLRLGRFPGVHRHRLP